MKLNYEIVYKNAPKNTGPNLKMLEIRLL